MILAAGLGTRLRPITNEMPKPMVPVCNRPLIGYAVEGFLAAGIDEIVVNLHYLPDPIVDYLTTTYDCRFEFSMEREILGTGGAIRRVREFLEMGDEFFLVNGDTIQFVRYQDLAEARRASDALASLSLRYPPSDDRFTPVYLHEGLITGFGNGTGEPLMFSGSHLISSRIFRHLPEKDVFGIVDAVYQPLLDREAIAGVVEDEPWFDVGTPQRLARANAGIRELMVAGTIQPPAGSRVTGTSIIEETAVIRGAVSRSSIGANTLVEGQIDDCAVWTDCHIGKDVVLERCIVGHGVELAGPADFRDVLLTRANGTLVVTPL